MIGIIGGTGPQGKGLALRLAVAGMDVMLGSREAARGASVAEELEGLVPDATGAIRGTDNASLPRAVTTLLVATPYDGLASTLPALAADVDGHVVMSAVNRLGFKGGPQALPVEAGSAAEEIAQLLPGGRVVTAFNNTSAVHLNDLDHAFDEDVLVCGDDDDAIDVTIALANRIDGLRGVACGPLAMAATIEAMTAVVIRVNQRYKVHAGVRITGI